MELLISLQAYPVLFICLMFILGACIGSFLNVVIYRLPSIMQQSWRAQCYVVLNLKEEYVAPKLNLFTPRSYCPHCKNTISFWRNVPLLTYLLQRGQCHQCKQRISHQYPLIELLTAVITAFLAWYFGPTLLFLAAIVFSWFLIPLIFIDLKHQFLPDELSLFLLWCGLFFNMFHIFTSAVDAIGGAILGYFIFWLIAQAFKLIRKKEGMGYGDFKLNAALGAWFGIKPLIIIILMSSLLGLVIGIILIFTKRLNKQQPIAFGPYLAIAGWIYLCWGPNIYQILLNLII